VLKTPSGRNSAKLVISIFTYEAQEYGTPEDLQEVQEMSRMWLPDNKNQ